MPVRFPDDSQRLSIVGATGSGKTQAAQWHLSHRNFHVMPWVIYNTKGDASIDAIPYAHQIDIDEIPAQPGIFIVRPLPHQQDELEAHLWSIWQRGNIGVYVDEGYSMGVQNEPFRSLLTQGRSKRIPLIVLSQRPVWLDRFVFSESEFFQAFRLQHAKDRAAIEQIIPARLERLPAYHSWYYDALGNNLYSMRPVPSIDVIHETFEWRLQTMRRYRVV